MPETSRVKDVAALVQAFALIAGVAVAVQELVIKDREAEKDARTNTIRLLERAEEHVLRAEINELNRLTILKEPSGEMVDFLVSRSNNLRAYISTFAGCINGELCDRNSGLPVLCPLLIRYRGIEGFGSLKMVSDNKIKTAAQFFTKVSQLSYITREVLVPECEEWRKMQKTR